MGSNGHTVGVWDTLDISVNADQYRISPAIDWCSFESTIKRWCFNGLENPLPYFPGFEDDERIIQCGKMGDEKMSDLGEAFEWEMEMSLSDSGVILSDSESVQSQTVE